MGDLLKSLLQVRLYVGKGTTNLATLTFFGLTSFKRLNNFVIVLPVSIMSSTIRTFCGIDQNKYINTQIFAGY